MAHRDLPARPDIKHLRKEAKKLFSRLHAQAPEAQLADAQFILAAEYGFKSWPRLKAEVERRNEKRWAARLAGQESFRPVPAEALPLPRPSLQRLWLGRQETEDDDAAGMMLEMAGIQTGFILLALVVALLMAVR